jgi:hypothetical protein
MTNQDFVKKRLEAMAKTPGMWGSTKESFGLQLVLLMEFHQKDEPDFWKKASYEAMKTVFGPGPIVSTEPLDDVWAKRAVALTRAFLRMETDG